jgi:hypothetical protein
MDMCHPEPESEDPETGAEIWSFGGGPCKGDINRIIRELEKIPDIELSNPYAAKELALLKVERDRPQDFEAAQEAKFRECVAPLIAHRKAAENRVPCPGTVRDGQCQVFECGNAYNECAPFATWEQMDRWWASAEKELN